MFCAIPTICFSGREVLAVLGRFPRYLLGIEMRVRFGDCVLDTDTRELFRKEKAVHLPPTAFRLLELLVERRPKALSKDQIHEKVWPGTFISEATLASAISDIRIALGDTDKKPLFIRTVHGYGYAFCGQAVENTLRQRNLGTGCFLLWRDQEFELPSGETTIGRGPGTSIVVNDDSVSHRHARLVIDQDSATLEDLESKNGTFLNNARVLQRSDLDDGAEILLGDTTMTFRRISQSDSTRSREREPKAEGETWSITVRQAVGRRKHGSTQKD